MILTQPITFFMQGFQSLVNLLKSVNITIGSYSFPLFYLFFALIVLSAIITYLVKGVARG